MEERALLWIHGFEHPVLDDMFYVTHILGTAWFCTGLVTVAALWWWWHGDRHEAALWAALGLSTWALQKALKILIARPRPELWEGAVSLSSFAFPSGHALAAVTFCALIGRTALRGWPHARRRVIASVGLGAALIGVGRLYLGVHWPSDVAAGWALGALQTWLGIRVLSCRGSAAR